MSAPVDGIEQLVANVVEMLVVRNCFGLEKLARIAETGLGCAVPLVAL